MFEPIRPKNKNLDKSDNIELISYQQVENPAPPTRRSCFWSLHSIGHQQIHPRVNFFTLEDLQRQKSSFQCQFFSGHYEFMKKMKSEMRIGVLGPLRRDVVEFSRYAHVL